MVPLVLMSGRRFMINKHFLALALLGLVGSVAAQPLNPAIDPLAARYSALQGTSWAAAAGYVQNKAPLFSVRPDLRLAPASTLKLLTSAAVLDAFGPQHRFQTQLYIDALPDEHGVLNGNLYIRAGGDPTLGSSRVQGSLNAEQLLQRWTQQIRQAGIRKINGDVYTDISLFEGPSIPAKVNWQNIGNYFAAPATALAFHDNSFQIHFAPQARPGARVEVRSAQPQTDGLRLRSFVTVDAGSTKDNAYVYGAPGQYEMEIYGTLPATRFTGYTISAALPDAPQLLTDLFVQTLESHGVDVSGRGMLLEEAPDYEAMRLLYTHFSPPLQDILYIVNKRSFNFYAEMLLRQLAVHAGHKGSVEAGLNELYRFLRRQGISTENVLLYDGSGLSRDNQLTVQTLLELLQVMAQRPDFPSYYYSLATLQDRGDLLLLRRFLAPFKRTQDVHVKGGTLDGVKAQAGYVRDQNGELIAFAFIANNLIAKDEGINRFYEDLLKLLLQQPQK